MPLLGIDFSLTSTAVTLKNSTEYVFYTFARENAVKSDVTTSLKTAGVEVHLVPAEAPLPKKATIAERERSSLEDAHILINKIVEQFKYLHDPITAYGIEGFSFGSTGNRLAQIAGYQWALRWEMRSIGMTSSNLWVFSPMTVKATAGKGNFKKEQMIEAFINSDDPLLQGNLFWLALKNNPEQFQTKKGNWLKPIDDVVDSYWVLKTTELNKELLKA
jgi:hypothetical protein